MQSPKLWQSWWFTAEGRVVRKNNSRVKKGLIEGEKNNLFIRKAKFSGSAEYWFGPVLASLFSASSIQTQLPKVSINYRISMYCFRKVYWNWLERAECKLVFLVLSTLVCEFTFFVWSCNFVVWRKGGSDLIFKTIHHVMYTCIMWLQLVVRIEFQVLVFSFLFSSV